MLASVWQVEALIIICFPIQEMELIQNQKACSFLVPSYLHSTDPAGSDFLVVKNAKNNHRGFYPWLTLTAQRSLLAMADSTSNQEVELFDIYDPIHMSAMRI